MKRKQWIIWLLLTILFGGVGLPLAFINTRTMLMGFLVYFPLTAGVMWLTVRRGWWWFGLWVLVLLAWLTYIGPQFGQLLPSY
jgi:hypothetical protein